MKLCSEKLHFDSENFKMRNNRQQKRNCVNYDLVEKGWKRHLSNSRAIKIQIFHLFLWTFWEFYFDLPIHSLFTSDFNSMFLVFLTMDENWISYTDRILCFERFISNKNAFENFGRYKRIWSTFTTPHRRVLECNSGRTSVETIERVQNTKLEMAETSGISDQRVLQISYEELRVAKLLES